MRKFLFSILFLILSSKAYAEDLVISRPPEIDFTSYFITLGILLFFVVALGFISIRLKNTGALPKLNLSLGGIIKAEKNIKVLERQMLEPRKTLYLVNVGKKNFLIGSSDTNLQLISEVDIENENSQDIEKNNMNIKEDPKDKKEKKFSDYLNLPLILPLIFLFISIFLFVEPSFAAPVPPATPGDIGSTNFLDQIDLKKAVQLKDLGTPLQLILFMAFLTLLPFFFIMTTSFMRTIIVLGFLRQAIGTQQVPPNQVIMGIAIFLTIYIMSPVYQEVNQKALIPYFDNKISQSVAMERGLKPIRNFMLKYTKKEELSFFMRMVKLPQPKTADDVPLHVIIPAYMVSELATGFKIGFFLFLPFLVVDLVVANTLLALGMMMLSPVTISMPFKLLIFTLANGWYLILQAIVTSFKM
ncbi:MAG: flagellar type III secretion system pore protein FliP [Candidatus Sericytochromatia bacterium]